MNKELKQLKPLGLPRNEYNVTKAFEGDLLGREKLASQLTGYLERLRVGAVLAIDAPWGEGKTWFGRNWEKYLKSDKYGYKVIYIDAFAQDYVEDPFLLIAAEITHIIGKDNNKIEFEKNVLEVAKALISSSPSFMINLVSRAAFHASPEDISKDNEDLFEGISELTKCAANKLVEKKLRDYDKEKKSFKKFRDELKEFCEKQDKPVVIFIDELDRCRPTFAVQLIERIKHLFDVPNLIFVLLLNRIQLENAIEGVYGTGTDASSYLGKFVNLFFHLPKNTSYKRIIHNDHTKAFIENVVKRYEFNASPETMFNKAKGTASTPSQEFIRYLSIWAATKNLSLRQIEHACTLFVLSNEEETALVSYLIVLKIKHVELFKRLVKNDRSAHDEARQNLAALEAEIVQQGIAQDLTWPNDYFRFLIELHQLQIGEISKENAVALENYSGQLCAWMGFDRDKTFKDAYNSIDLPVEI